VSRGGDQAILRALLASADVGAAFPAALLASDARVTSLARHHRLSPLLAVAAPEGFSSDVVETFRRDRLTTLGRSTLFRHALQALLSAFDQAGVDVAVLKGIAYEDLVYAQPGTRPASDIDLLVRPGQRREAFAVLSRLGYVPYASAPGFDELDYHEVSFRWREVNLDLHFALAPLVRCRIDYARVWSQMQVWSLSGRPTRTLGFTHAALNQALHMAIHHFDVPAIYLLDFRRLVERSGPGGLARLRAAAGAWRCVRALNTTLALERAFLPGTAAALGGIEAHGEPRSEDGPMTRRVVRSFGGLSPIPRAEQLARKLAHFDDIGIAFAYLSVQGRRILRERWLELGGDARSAAERLAIPDPAPSRRLRGRPL